MTTDYPTVTLKNGVVVLAKIYKGDLRPITYANRAQAYAKVLAMPDGWYVEKSIYARPFYVAKLMEGDLA